MNKKQNKKTKQDFMGRFTPLSEIVAKELKNPWFRKSYTEEVSHLQFAYKIRLLRTREA